jgi:hypothetical protein
VRGNLSLSFKTLAFSKPQVTGDISHGPHLPKEKEPSHCGDIEWDWFLLRQFDLQTSSFYPCYKLCDNMPLKCDVKPLGSDVFPLLGKSFGMQRVGYVYPVVS